MNRRIDPIFRIATPILFAHPGGAKEAPESTEAGFRHAIECRTDVFELDVQLTKDEEMVVWHGPSLDNVRLEWESVVGRSRDRFNIQYALLQRRMTLADKRYSSTARCN